MSDELTWARVHTAMKAMAVEKSEWAGIPMPLTDYKLELESKYPYQLGKLGKQEPDASDTEVVNTWWCHRLQATAGILREKATGKLFPCLDPSRASDILISTYGTLQAWPFEAENRAMEKLATMISLYQFKAYMLTGTFLESSPRSNITYCFRRLRPTLAFSKNGPTAKLLAGLCMHPIGYYGGTWAGCMVPTDDLMAHLLFMRGDEHGFWKMCNQHAPGTPQCGI